LLLGYDPGGYVGYAKRTADPAAPWDLKPVSDPMHPVTIDSRTASGPATSTGRADRHPGDRRLVGTSHQRGRHALDIPQSVVRTGLCADVRCRLRWRRRCRRGDLGGPPKGPVVARAEEGRLANARNRTTASRMSRRPMPCAWPISMATNCPIWSPASVIGLTAPPATSNPTSRPSSSGSNSSVKMAPPISRPTASTKDSGIGTQFTVADVNGDGLLDICLGQQKGCPGADSTEAVKCFPASCHVPPRRNASWLCRAEKREHGSVGFLLLCAATNLGRAPARAPLGQDAPVGHVWRSVGTQRSSPPCQPGGRGPLAGSPLDELLAPPRSRAGRPARQTARPVSTVDQIPRLPLAAFRGRFIRTMCWPPACDRVNKAKTEAWVILSAEPEARIYAGLRPAPLPPTCGGTWSMARWPNCLHSFVPSRETACFCRPAPSTASGGGVLMAEVSAIE